MKSRAIHTHDVDFASKGYKLYNDRGEITFSGPRDIRMLARFGTRKRGCISADVYIAGVLQGLKLGKEDKIVFKPAAADTGSCVEQFLSIATEFAKSDKFLREELLNEIHLALNEADALEDQTIQIARAAVKAYMRGRD